MKSLKLKSLQLNDNFPLIISLIGKVGWGIDEEMNLVDRDDTGCNFSTISQIKLYPSSDKEKIESILNDFLNVCDDDLSPQCMWKTDDGDYMSLLLEYKKASEFEFDQNVERIIETFPDLIQSENVLLEIPKDKKIKNMIYMIEVAYPTTWNIEFFEPELCCETEFNLIRLHSRNGVSLLAKTRKDNTLVEYLVEENSNNGKRVYGVGHDLHAAFITFLSFLETEN